MTTKLLVSFGEPLQLSDGETLSPVQVNELNTCGFLMVAPSLTSALVSFIPASAAVAANAPKITATVPNAILCIVSSLGLGGGS